MKLVLVEWKDSCSGLDWSKRQTTIDEAEATTILSVGLLAKETKSEYVLLPNISLSTDHILHEIAIPRGAVTRIRQLKIAPAAICFAA